jgi:hypothetical protein
MTLADLLRSLSASGFDFGRVDQTGNLAMPTTTSWFPRFVNVGFEWRLRAGRCEPPKGAVDFANR